MIRVRLMSLLVAISLSVGCSDDATSDVDQGIQNDHAVPSDQSITDQNSDQAADQPISDLGEGCGNGVIDGDEVCDKSSLDNQSCTTKGFDNGELKCNATCDGFDTSDCGICGDGNINPAGEQCDGTNLNNKGCADVGYTAGTLKCSDTCVYDKSSCTGPKMLTNILFIHHSVGANIVSGGLRSELNKYNSSNSTSFELWDQIAYGTDINDPSGQAIYEGGYNVPTDSYLSMVPEDWKNAWTSSSSQYQSFRDAVLAKHDIIAFKSCFFIVDQTEYNLLASSADLTTFKNHYLAMRTFFDSRPDKLFIVMGNPPTVANNTNATQASLARQFATWLCSDAYLSGHPNVKCYNLFDRLAIAEGQTNANTLDLSYAVDAWDPHLNATGSSHVATDFAVFLGDSAKNYIP